MEPVLQWGLDVIITIQQVRGPALDTIFRAITSLGAEEFYLLMLPCLFWCADFGLGARVGVFLLLSNYLNLTLKDLFQQPRPFDLDPGVQLATAEGYGLPSGHTQSSVVVWGAVAAWGRQKWVWAVAVALMVLIGFSRIYLGVHFPTDVLAAWGIGAVSLALYVALEGRVTKWLAGLRLGLQVLLALALSLVLLVIHPVKETAIAMGALAGAGAGIALTYRYVPFSARGPPWQRIVRFLIGAAVVILLYGGLKLVFPGEGSSLYLAFRFLRYGLIGLWSSLGAPWLFRLLRLAPQGRTRA